MDRPLLPDRERARAEDPAGLPAARGAGRGHEGGARAALLAAPIAGGAALLGLAALAWAVGSAVPDGWLRAAPRGRVADGDAFVAFGFGLRRSAGGAEAAGGSNLALARWLVDHNPRRRPAVVQEGVYLALRELAAADPALDPDGWAVRLPHRPGAYVDTAGAALQARAVLGRLGLRRPVVLAHDLQLARAARCLGRLGVDVIVPGLPPVPFDPGSAQPWTRYRWLWKAKEVLHSWPAAVVGPAAYWLLVGLALGLAARPLLGASASLARRLLRRPGHPRGR